MRKVITFGILSFSLLIIYSSDVIAMSPSRCTGERRTFNYYITSATDIFVGSVESSDNELVIVKIKEALKGNLEGIITLKKSLMYLNVKPGDVGVFHLMRVRDDSNLYGAGDCNDAWLPLNNDRAIEVFKWRDKRHKLEEAVAENLNNAASLIALAKFEERWNEMRQAEQTYRKASAFDNGTAAYEGMKRAAMSLAKSYNEDYVWNSEVDRDMSAGEAHVASGASEEILKRESTNTEAKRILMQSSILEGNLKNIATSDLRGGNFSFLALSEQQMPRAKLNNSEIGYLEAGDSDLSGADFSEIELASGTFAHANLTGAVLKNARFACHPLNWGVCMNSTLIHSGVTITGANFSKITGPLFLTSFAASDAIFDNANLEGSILEISEQAGMQKNMPTVSFKKAKLKKANLKIDGIEADFSGADLTHAGFWKSDLTKSNFELADLRGTDFTMAKLEGARFDRSIYDCNTIWPVGFDPKSANLELNNKFSECHSKKK